MRGSVLLVLAALGLATVGSTLLWIVRRITWRRPAPFLERLGSVSPVPGREVGPAGGISRLDPLPQQPPDEHSGPADRSGPAEPSAAPDAPVGPER